MRFRPIFTTLLLALGLAALLVAGAANAASISYWLDQTNTQTTDPLGSAYDHDNALPDGPLYLKVTFTDSATPGDIDVTVDILSPLLSIADANFGLQSFYFNTTNGALLASEIIGLPSPGWSASTDFNPSPPNQNADGFGGFEVMVSDGGFNRQTPTLMFTIQSAGDSINSYAEGDPFFAAHVTGFFDQNSLDPLDPIDGEGLCTVDIEGNYSPGCNILTSVWVAGSNPVPEPSTALLLLGGLSGLAVMGRRRLH